MVSRSGITAPPQWYGPPKPWPPTQHATIPYHTIPYHTKPNQTKPNKTKQNKTKQNKTKQYNTIHYTTLHYNRVLYNTIRYDTMRYDTSTTPLPPPRGRGATPCTITWSGGVTSNTGPIYIEISQRTWRSSGPTSPRTVVGKSSGHWTQVAQLASIAPHRPQLATIRRNSARLFHTGV